MPGPDAPLKIEKGIPLAERRGKPERFPLSKMEVGDSFFAAAEDRAAAIRIAKKIRSAVSGVMKRRGRDIKFACRTLSENGRDGVRTWRLA